MEGYSWEQHRSKWGIVRLAMLEYRRIMAIRTFTPLWSDCILIENHGDRKFNFPGTTWTKFAVTHPSKSWWSNRMRDFARLIWKVEDFLSHSADRFEWSNFSWITTYVLDWNWAGPVHLVWLMIRACFMCCEVSGSTSVKRWSHCLE